MDATDVKAAQADLIREVDRLRGVIRVFGAVTAILVVVVGGLVWSVTRIDDDVDRVGLTTDEIRTVVGFAEENNRILCVMTPEAPDCDNPGIDGG